jgi:hypothetical protein
MNWDQVKGNWKQFKGKVKEKWGKMRVHCGLEAVRVQPFTEGELKELRAVIDESQNGRPDDRRAEPAQPGREPGVNPEQEPGNTPETPEAERPPDRKEGVVSDPDFAAGR